MSGNEWRMDGPLFDVPIQFGDNTVAKCRDQGKGECQIVGIDDAIWIVLGSQWDEPQRLAKDTLVRQCIINDANCVANGQGPLKIGGGIWFRRFYLWSNRDNDSPYPKCQSFTFIMPHKYGCPHSLQHNGEVDARVGNHVQIGEGGERNGQPNWCQQFTTLCVAHQQIL